MYDIGSHTDEFDRQVEHLSQELKTLRTGRANAAIVEHVSVDAYGVPTPVQHLASISVSDAKTIVITPWDKGVLKDIEKAIVQANIGVNPINDGIVIRLVMPNLTEEARKTLVKALGQKVEHAKVALRSIRERIRDEITQAEKNKEIAEDDRFKLQKELDDMTRDYSARLDEMGSAKEKEIMTI